MEGCIVQRRRWIVKEEEELGKGGRMGRRVVEGWRIKEIDAGWWRRRTEGCGGIVELITLGE